MLTVNGEDLVMVKSGFASGYGGTAPNGFSYVLSVLEHHDVPIDEVDVSAMLMERVDRACLRVSDLAAMKAARPVQPARWQDYVMERHWNRRERVWREFDGVVPFAIIDERLIDIAKDFRFAPAERLLLAYRRLEEGVRKRIGSDQRSSKLFHHAFVGPEAPLHWPELDDAEAGARAEFFKSTYSAFRNRRAHGEPKDAFDDMLSEFLVVNALYRLERAAEHRPTSKVVAKRRDS